MAFNHGLRFLVPEPSIAHCCLTVVRNLLVSIHSYIGSSDELAQEPASHNIHANSIYQLIENVSLPPIPL